MSDIVTANQGKITTMGGTTGLVDQTDKMHTGLLKALEVFSQGSMIIGHANFEIGDEGDYVGYTLHQPFHFKTLGKYITYGTDITISYTSNQKDASYDKYDWVLLNPNLAGNPELVIVPGTLIGANALVSDITYGYIPVALVKVPAGSDTDSTTGYQAQLFTFDNKTNEVSVGYSSGGYYTESGTLTSASTGTTLTSIGDLSLASADDITVKLGGTAVGNVFAVTDSADEVQLSVTGTGLVNVPSLTASKIIVTDANKNLISADFNASDAYQRTGGTITGDVTVNTTGSSVSAGKNAIEIDLDITAAIGVGNTGNNKGIVVDLNATGDVNGNSATVSHAGTVNNTGIEIDVVGSTGGTQKNVGLDVVVSGADTNYSALFNGGFVGIGNTAPIAPLHITTADNLPQLLLESTDDDANVGPELLLKRNTSPDAAADNDLIGKITFQGMSVVDGQTTTATVDYVDISTKILDKSDGSEDAEFEISAFVAGTKRSILLHGNDASNLETVFNEDSQDINFRVESNAEANMIFMDADTNRVGLKTATPASTLDVGGNARIVSPSDAAGTALIVDNADTDQQAIHIEAQNITANVLDITADALTTHNALDISSTGLTTGKGINLVSSSVPADGATHVANAIVTANTSVNTQTVTGLLFDYNKTGETASGKTATVTGIHLDMDDDANHASGTVLMTGLDIDVTSATDAGTLTNTGLDIVVAGADSNIPIRIEGGGIQMKETTTPTATADYGQVYTKSDNHLYFQDGAGVERKVTEEVFIVSLSDEATNLTTGVAKASFRMPFAMTLTGVKAGTNIAPTGAPIIVDINETPVGGSLATILSTKLSIDVNEFTSSSAIAAAVISDTALANDSLITFDIDQIGSTAAGKGLKVTLYGYRT